MRSLAICSLLLIPAFLLAQPLPKTMKAVVAHEYGGPEVLKLEEIPVPEPKENEILVRVIASGVNPADPLILGGKYAKEFGTHLIHGGSGGVGSFAIQIAKARGARVIATASAANQDLLKQLGADVSIDYTKPNWEETVHDVDFALLPVGGETMRRTYGVMKK